MINIEKLHKMYEGIIDGSELLTKDLRSFGFSKREINELLSKKILVRVQKGIYDLTTVDNLFLYGIDLKNNGDRQRGLQCIKKCYEIDPTHIKVCLRLFKEALLDENVEESISYIKEIDVNDFINDGNYFNNTMFKLYLYLLNKITELPSEYKRVASALTYDDVVLSATKNPYHEKKSNLELENELRKAIFNNQYDLAIKLLTDIKQKRIENDIRFLILLILLKELKSKYKLIEEKCQLLRQDGGIILLDGDNVNEEVKDYIKGNYEDIIAFEIGDTNNHKLVLRYTSKKLNIFYTKYFSEGIELFRQKKYRESIEHFKKLLSVGAPYSNVYNFIGLSYLGINEPKNAIPYLIVTTELNKNEQEPYKGKYDYTGLVNMIETRIKDAIDLKQNPRLSTTHSLDRINDYIILTGLDVERACKELGLTEKEIAIALLTYAKEYFVRGNIKKGEEYISIYLQKKTSSIESEKLLKEIEELKKLNRENSEINKTLLLNQRTPN